MNENIHKKYILTIAITIALLAFSYASIQFVHSYEKTIEPSSFRSFSVSSEGSVVAVPDIATFSFTVISEGDTDLAALQADNAQKVNAIGSFLEEKDINKKDIKTTEYSVNPRYKQCYAYREPSGVCPPPQIVGYTVRQSTLVKIRDFNVIGDVLAEVVNLGANSVSQLQFGIDDETVLEAQAREEAIEKAYEKAKQIAKAGNFNIGKILDITEGYSSPYRSKYNYAMEATGFGMEDAAFAPAIEAGSQDVIVSVTITYEIE
ncbi:MAG: SIMPL domain-containing protein [Candidatus Pacebacteria bacterium]|nr:SIMPL domain-containing protein [Candidatus Paceibacterota bacterium]